MKNLITLVLAVAVSVQVFSQTRLLYSYQEIEEEYNSYAEEDIVNKVIYIEETKKTSASITLLDRSTDTKIIQYLTDGKDEESFVYRTVTLIPKRSERNLKRQLGILDQDYIKKDSNAWVRTEYEIEIECEWIPISRRHKVNEFVFNFKRKHKR